VNEICHFDSLKKIAVGAESISNMARTHYWLALNLSFVTLLYPYVFLSIGVQPAALLIFELG